MNHPIELKTERLKLRQWLRSDRKPFSEMSADPQVMEFFPKTLDRAESDAIIDKCEALIENRGWGVWAVEHSETKVFMGMVGLHVPTSKLPCSPCVEILWRLARPFWGKGYATEAAKKVLKVGFEQLDLKEIVSFAVVDNDRSRSVMERIGMVDTKEVFDHPEVPEDSLLRKHCLYKITMDRWKEHLV